MFETRSRLLPLFIRSVNFTLLEFILCYNYLSGTSHRFSLLPFSLCEYQKSSNLKYLRLVKLSDEDKLCVES